MFVIERALFFYAKLVASSQQAAWRALRNKEQRQPSKLYGYAGYDFVLFKSVKMDCAQLAKCKWFHNTCLLFLRSFQQQPGRALWKTVLSYLSPMELDIFQQLLCGNNLLRNLARLIKLLGPAQLTCQPTDAGVTLPLQEDLTQNDGWHVQLKACDSKSPKWTYEMYWVLWIHVSHSHSPQPRLQILYHNWPRSWAFCHQAGTWEIEPAGEG